MVIDLQNSDAWKTQLTIAINFISSKDAEEECVMDSTRNRKKFTLYSHANDIIDKLFESLLSSYQENLEPSMAVSDFIFDSVQLMYHKCNIMRKE